MIKKYLELIKPGIVLGNLVSVIGGFCFAFENQFNFFKLIFTLIATSLIIASACVFNNIIDIDIDKKMTRTKNRVLVQSLLPVLYAKIYGIFLFLIGTNIFLIKVNFLVFLLSILGFCIYVFLYTIYMKRNSLYSVFFGSLSGAIPSIIGYCAVSNIIDFKACLLFFCMVLWQIPHSYSIFLFRLKDYKRSKLPVISLKKGILRTIQEIIFYISCFSMMILILFFFHYININFLIILSSINILWLLIAIKCYYSDNYYYFSRMIFYFSIIVVFIFNILLVFYNIRL